MRLVKKPDGAKDGTWWEAGKFPLVQPHQPPPPGDNLGRLQAQLAPGAPGAEQGKDKGPPREPLYPVLLGARSQTGAGIWDSP